MKEAAAFWMWVYCRLSGASIYWPSGGFHSKEFPRCCVHLLNSLNACDPVPSNKSMSWLIKATHKMHLVYVEAVKAMNISTDQDLCLYEYIWWVKLDSVTKSNDASEVHFTCYFSLFFLLLQISNRPLCSFLFISSHELHLQRKSPVTKNKHLGLG